MKRLLPVFTALALLITAAPALADLTVAGTGEPRFTNTTTNTQWAHYQGSSSYESNQLEYEYYDNSTFNRMLTVPVAANGNADVWANWSGIVSPLLEGHTYGICVFDRYTIGGLS